MNTKHIRSEKSAHQQLVQAAKRTPAQQDAALKALVERNELLRRLGV